jgi:hypothetical protein
VLDLARQDRESDAALANPKTEYSRAKQVFIAAHPRCQACGVLPIPRTARPACDIHHQRGRLGSLLMDTRFWSAVCRDCHNWIHANPAAAKAVGLIGPWHKTDL